MVQLTSLDLADMRQLGLDAVDRHILDLIRLEAIGDGEDQPAGTIQRLKALLRAKENDVRELERQLRQMHMQIMRVQRDDDSGAEEEDDDDGDHDDDGSADGDEEEDIYDEERRQSRSVTSLDRHKARLAADKIASIAAADAHNVGTGDDPAAHGDALATEATLPMKREKEGKKQSTQKRQPQPQPEPQPEPEPEPELELQPAVRRRVSPIDEYDRSMARISATHRAHEESRALTRCAPNFLCICCSKISRIISDDFGAAETR